MSFPFETGFPADRGVASRVRQSTALRAELERLQTETVTGRAADPAASLGGRTAEAQRLEAALGALEGYESAAGLMASRASAQQDALSAVRSATQTLVDQAQSAVNSGSFTGLSVAEPAARQALEATVSALNARFAGRALFAGNAGDGPALASAADITAAATTAIAGAPDAATADASVRALFDTTGGTFDTSFYVGGAGDAAAAGIAPGETARLTLKGDDDAFRAVLREMTALFSAVGGPGSAEEKRALVSDATNGLRTALDDLAEAAGTLGVTEQRIEAARTRNAAEETVLNEALTGLVGRDQFEAAGALQATEIALETLLVTTARISNLSLTRFL
ncbi:MAG: flagellin [Pseudomonadota bacterium]